MIYELKKIFSTKIKTGVIFGIIILFFFFIFVGRSEEIERRKSNTMKINNCISEYAQKGNIYSNSLEDKAAMENLLISGEYIKYNPRYGKDFFEDYLVVDTAYNYVNYIYNHFETNRKQMVTEMLYNLVLEEKKDNTNQSLIRMYDKAIDMYNEVIDFSPEFAGNADEESYLIFNYNLSDFILLVFLIWITVSSYMSEYSGCRIKLLNTSKYIYRDIYIKKMLTCFSCGEFVLLALSVVEVVFYIAVCGITNFAVPIQQLSMFDNCPFNITLLDYFIVKFITKSIVICFTISITGLLTVVIKKGLLSLVTSSFMCIGGYSVYAIFENIIRDSKTDNDIYNNLFIGLRTYIPFSMFDIRYFFNGFDYMSISGYPVCRLIFLGVFTIFMSVVAVSVGYRLTGRIKLDET